MTNYKKKEEPRMKARKKRFADGGRAAEGTDAAESTPTSYSHKKLTGSPEKADKAKSGKKDRRRKLESTQQFSDILDVRDGVIITKDQRFVKLLEFNPINLELRSQEEQAAIISRFSAVIRTWPDNVHLKIISARSDVESYINDLKMRREAELQSGSECCAEMIEDQIGLIRATSQIYGVTRRFFVMFEYEMDAFKRRPPFVDIVQTLNREAHSIVSGMEACGNTLRSSDDRDYILETIYSIMCRTQSAAIPFSERKRAAIERYEKHLGGTIDESIIPVNDLLCPDRIDTSVSPKYIVVDGLYTAYCYLPASAYPVQASAGWLQVLFTHMDDVDVDFWVRREDVAKAQRRLSLALKSNKIRAFEKDDISSDYDDVLASIRSGYYIKQALSNGDDLCYMSTILTVMAASAEELKARVAEMQNHCIRNDMVLRRCVFQQAEAHRACMPLAAYSETIFNKSKRNITASQLGSAYPFSAYELADEGGVFLGVNASHGSPVFLNTFDTTKYQSANMLIMGPSGSGKTYTLLSMLLRMRQKGLQIIIIAPLKGHEFRRACRAIGGEFIRIAPGSDQNINIMEIRKTDKGDSALIGDEDIMEKGSILSNKIQQLHSFFTVLLPDRTEVEKQILDEAMKEVYSRFGITEDNGSLIDPATGEYKKMPTLADLYAVLRDTGHGKERVFNTLTRYVTGSAKTFSQPTNVNMDNKFLVFDVSDLTAEMLPVGMFISLDFVMDKAKQDITKRKVIAIDEMWRLMKASRQCAEFVLQVFKEIRGYAGAAIGATQDLSDILSDDIGAAVINNTKFKFFLPMDKREADTLARVIDLTSEELNQLKRTAIKTGGARQGLLVANTNHLFIEIRTSATEHNLITTNAADLQRIAARKALLREHT